MARRLETHCFTAETVEDAVAQGNNLNIDGRLFKDSHISPNPKGVTFVVVLENPSGSDEDVTK